MKLKLRVCLTTIIATNVLNGIAVADIYDPGTDIKTSFAEAIDNPEVLTTPKIRKVAERVRKFNDESAEGEARIKNGLLSLKEIVSYARQNLDMNRKLESDLLLSIESLLSQLTGAERRDELISSCCGKY